MTKETIEQVLQFRDERNWKQFHNPKDLAISISLEAAELLEVFQWSAEDVRCEEKKDKIREELADVLNYCILMADTCPALGRLMPQGATHMATDSVKQGHYIPAILGLQSSFGSVDDCIEAAVSGRWKGEF